MCQRPDLQFLLEISQICYIPQLFHPTGALYFLIYLGVPFLCQVSAEDYLLLLFFPEPFYPKWRNWLHATLIRAEVLISGVNGCTLDLMLTWGWVLISCCFFRGFSVSLGWEVSCLFQSFKSLNLSSIFVHSCLYTNQFSDTISFLQGVLFILLRKSI